MPTTLSGKIVRLRVNDVGDSIGPPGDAIRADVIVTLESHLSGAFSGFQLRNDDQRYARQGMLDLLRDAFNNGRRAHFDHEVPLGKKNGTIMRVWVTKDAPSGGGSGGGGSIVGGVLFREDFRPIEVEPR